MHFRPWLSLIPGIALSLAATGCSRPQSQSPDRLAIHAIEDLSPDSAEPWLGTLGRAVLEYDLSGSAKVITTPERIGADRELRGYLVRRGDRLEVHLALCDVPAAQTTRMIVKEGPAGEGIVPLLDAVARDVADDARAFATRDRAALRSYGEALDATDMSARVRLLKTAAGQDPKFSAAYLAMAGVYFAGHDLPGVAAIASTGVRNVGDRLDRAELEDYGAIAKQDPGAREKTLTALAKLRPGHMDTLRALGQTHTIQRKYRDAISDYETVLAAEPWDADAYNFLGYLHAYRGDLTAATESLSTYQKLTAGDPNAFDSLGEVHFYLGNFLAAERYFRQAYDKDANTGGGRELLKAAQAQLMTGDLPGADAVFRKALSGSRGGAPEARELLLAQWEFITGRRKQALARSRRIPGDVAGPQLAIWQWQTAGQPVTGNIPDGVARILQRRFADAIPLLEKSYKETSNADDGEVRTLLAWAYMETNRAADARPLLQLYPLPLTPGTAFSSLAFPRFLKLRALSLKADQKLKEAEVLDQLYARYAGDLPDPF